MLATQKLNKDFLCICSRKRWMNAMFGTTINPYSIKLLTKFATISYILSGSVIEEELYKCLL